MHGCRVWVNERLNCNYLPHIQRKKKQQLCSHKMCGAR